jgi:hypothetical protein
MGRRATAPCAVALHLRSTAVSFVGRLPPIPASFPPVASSSSWRMMTRRLATGGAPSIARMGSSAPGPCDVRKAIESAAAAIAEGRCASEPYSWSARSMRKDATSAIGAPSTMPS